MADMDPRKVAELKAFVSRCESDPSILHHPSLAFFSDFVHSFDAKIPPVNMSSNIQSENDPNSQKTEDVEEEDEIVESDVELDGETVEPDNDPPQKMGDPLVEISEENRDAAQTCKAKALDAISAGNLDGAIEHLTEAIMLNPSSAILYAARASAYVKVRKPNAAIRDADTALQINPESAKGYKFRGIAKTMLGHWEGAVGDLRVASKLDYDEEINSVLKKVERNVHKIEDHRRKYERLREERKARKVEREKQRKKTEAKLKQDAKTKESADLQDGSVIIIHSSSELQTKLSAALRLFRLVILYFTATWCGPCRIMAPVSKSLAEKYPKVVFLKLDIDQLGDVAHSWGVNSVPTFFFVKDGKKIDKVVGADKNGLESKIALHGATK